MEMDDATDIRWSDDDADDDANGDKHFFTTKGTMDPMECRYFNAFTQTCTQTNDTETLMDTDTATNTDTDTGTFKWLEE